MKWKSFFPATASSSRYESTSYNRNHTHNVPWWIVDKLYGAYYMHRIFLSHILLTT